MTPPSTIIMSLTTLTELWNRIGICKSCGSQSGVNNSSLISALPSSWKSILWWLPATADAPNEHLLLPSTQAGRLLYPQPEDAPCCDGVKMAYSKQSEMRTKTHTYFLSNNKPYEGRREYQWGLDIFITNSQVATAAGCRQSSFLWHAFGKTRSYLAACSHCGIQSINKY
jgi:hypothetical protein